MNKKYSRYPFFAIVKALVEQGYTIRSAYNAAYYQRYRKVPLRRRTVTDRHIAVWLAKVKTVPVIDIQDFHRIPKTAIDKQ